MIGRICRLFPSSPATTFVASNQFSFEHKLPAIGPISGGSFDKSVGIYSYICRWFYLPQQYTFERGSACRTVSKTMRRRWCGNCRPKPSFRPGPFPVQRVLFLVAIASEAI